MAVRKVIFGFTLVVLNDYPVVNLVVFILLCIIMIIILKKYTNLIIF